MALHLFVSSLREKYRYKASGLLMSCCIYLNQIYNLDFSSIFPLHTLLTRFIVIQDNVRMLKEGIPLLMLLSHPNSDWHNSCGSGEDSVEDRVKKDTLSPPVRKQGIQGHMSRAYTETHTSWKTNRRNCSPIHGCNSWTSLVSHWCGGLACATGVLWWVDGWMKAL